MELKLLRKRQSRQHSALLSHSRKSLFNFSFNAVAASELRQKLFLYKKMHLISSARKTLLCIQLILLYSFCFVPMAFLVEYDQYCTKKGMRKKEAERISIQDKTIDFPNAFLNFYQKLLKITTATLRCTPFTTTVHLFYCTYGNQILRG